VATRAAEKTEGVTPEQALAFVERHGIVCEASRRGAIRSLVDHIAGGTVRGNWWSHPRSRAIFAATRVVRDSPEVLVCRLVDGKITLVHRRLWPSLVRIADRFEASRLARLREVHSASGRHVIEQTPFPDWLPADVLAGGHVLDVAGASAQLQDLIGRKEEI
jgi:hypothetical protein